MPYISIENHKRLAEYYFAQEFSNNSLEDIINKITKIERKNKEYWQDKIQKIIELYHGNKKHPTETAAYIASLFRPRLKNLL